MLQRTYITLQKLNAELNTIIDTFFEENKGGAFSIVIIGIAITVTALLMLVNSIDFAMYSHKRNIISRAVDYAVSAAVQEIDYERSGYGLARGFDGRGNISLNNTFLHEQRADNAFFSTFESNTGISRDYLKSSMVIAIVNPVDTGVDYIIKTNTGRYTGITEDPAMLEQLLNDRINEYWATEDPEADKHIIFVNGNPSVTGFKKRPYYIVFIRDYRIDGLFRRRTATFVGFKGAKVERKN